MTVTHVLLGGIFVSRVSIVVDSSASLPAYVAAQYGINVIPITIQRGNETYRDGIDLGYEQFYEMLEQQAPLKTSQPSPGEFIQMYRSLAKECESIISIHVTSKASGTVQAANLARAACDDLDIEVVDSETTSMSLGFLAIVAATAARLGKHKREILQAVEEAKKRIDVFVALPGLSQLRRSGKIGLGQSLIGSLLSVKPILTMRDGMLTVCERVRTYPKARERVADLICEAAGRGSVRLAVVYSKTLDEAQRLAEMLQLRLKVSEVIMAEIGAALAVHGGPGMIGAAIMRE